DHRDDVVDRAQARERRFQLCLVVGIEAAGAGAEPSCRRGEAALVSPGDCHPRAGLASLPGDLVADAGTAADDQDGAVGQRSWPGWGHAGASRAILGVRPGTRVLNSSPLTRRGRGAMRAIRGPGLPIAAR